MPEESAAAKGDVDSRLVLVVINNVDTIVGAEPQALTPFFVKTHGRATVSRRENGPGSD
jgi:hypothetical protein